MAPPPGTWGPPWSQPPSEMRYRPGGGAVLAVVGLVLFVVSLFGLPWVSEGGQDVSFPDIREAVDIAQESNVAGVSGPSDYLDLYAGGFWIFVIAIAAGAMVVATLFVPRTAGSRLVVGFLAGGFIGLIVMAVDKQGTVGPRVLGALLTVGAAVTHGLAVREFFDGTGFSPAYGVWTGFVGLALLLVGCIVGTQVDRGPTAWRLA